MENFLNRGREFGLRLRKLRKEKGLSQRQLADILGYKHNASISGIEAGKTPLSIETFVKITEVFDVDLHWLITGHRAMFKSHLNLAQTALKHISVNLYQLIEKKQRAEHVINVLSLRGNQSEKVNLKLDNLKKELSRYSRLIQETVDDFNYVNQLIENQKENQQTIADNQQ